MCSAQHKRQLRIDFPFRHLGRFGNHWAKFKARTEATRWCRWKVGGAMLGQIKRPASEDLESLAYDKAGLSISG